MVRTGELKSAEQIEKYKAHNIFDNILPHCSYAQMLMKQMWFVIIVKIIQENINESSNEMWIFQKLHFVLIFDLITLLVENSNSCVNIFNLNK